MRKTAWRVCSSALLVAVVSTVFTFTASTAGAAIVGSGGSGAGWLTAFLRAGAIAGIGLPENDVHWWGPGCLQDYQGGYHLDAALMSPGCDQSRVYLVAGQDWSHVTSLGAPSIGYPDNDTHRWGAGWTQDFAGGTLGLYLVMRGDGVGRTYGVFGAIRTYYMTHGGAPGPLGYPRSNEYTWNNLIRQDFEGGSLIWSPQLVAAKPLAVWPDRTTIISRAVSGAVYVIIGGRSYGVTSPTQLEQCYGGWSPVRDISAESLEASLAVYPYAGAAPDCTGIREQRAVSWARSMLGLSGYNGWCELFVERAFGTSGRYASAATHLNRKRATGELHADTNVPAGALAFFAPSWQNGQYGHVMLSLGGGAFISSGRVVFVTGINTNYFGPYAGWAWADTSWSGRTS